MKNCVTVFLWLVFSLHAAAQQKPVVTFYDISGHVNRQSSFSKIYLLYQTEGRRFVDSSAIVKNRFHFYGTVNEPVFATFLLDHQSEGLSANFKKPVDETDMLHFYLHTGGFSITAADSINTARFGGSDINRDYSELKVLENVQAEHLLIKLSANMQRDKDSASAKRYVIYYDSLKQARRAVLKQFVISHPQSYISVVALREYTGSFPVVNEIYPLFNSLSAKVRNTAEGKNLKTLLDSEKQLAIGATAPDFTQNDPNSNPIMLSSFKGKYVLIDFWASWCVACRDENPALVKVFQQLKNKNFTILGVSLDSYDTRENWLHAIKEDGLIWKQVSDLKHWDNAVVKQYGIGAIPQNLLINPAGKIIAKNIEPGDIVKEMEIDNVKK